MSLLNRLNVSDTCFTLDIFVADVTHVTYRGDRPTTEPGRYSDLPNYALSFEGRGELGSNVTVYLLIKCRPPYPILDKVQVNNRKFEVAYQDMVNRLSIALDAKLIDEPSRQNLNVLALLHGSRPTHMASFSPTDTNNLPVIILTNDQVRISIFAKNVREPILSRDKFSETVHGLVGWAGFEGFFEIDGTRADLGKITDRDKLVQDMYAELIAAWDFLPKLSFWMVELNQLKSVKNIDEIATCYSSTAGQVNPCRINHAQDPVVEVWRDVNLGFVFSYLLHSVPAHQLAKAVQPLFNAASTDEPLVNVSVADEGRTVSITLSSYSVKDDDQTPEAVVVVSL